MATSKLINTVLLINWALSNCWKHILQIHDSEFACKHGKVLGFSLISFWVYPSTFLEKHILNINPWIYFIVLWAYWSFYPLEPISLIVCSNDPIPLIHLLNISHVSQWLQMLVIFKNQHCIILVLDIQHLNCSCLIFANKGDLI